MNTSKKTTKAQNIRNTNTYFNGWAVPGPPPDTEAMHAIALDDGETLDALCGHFRIFQLKDGHRFSTDDILTAWYGSSWCPSAMRVLDLGSGIGSVGMVAAWRLPGAHFVTIEAQEQSVALAKKSAQYNGITHRYDIRLGDFRNPDILHNQSGFDLILGSPPYFPLQTGSHSEHPQKLACRFEVRGDISDYCRTAAQHLNPGGVFACVFPIQPPHQLQRVQEAAAQTELIIVRQRPIILCEGQPAHLCLFLMYKRDDLPETMRDQTWEEPPLIIRQKDGTIHPEYRAVKLAIGFPP